MISTICLFICDFLITVISIPFIFIFFILPFWLYKTGVHLLAKIFHSNYVPIDTNDSFMVWDIIKPTNERHVYSVGVSLRILGKITVQRIQQRFKEKILNIKERNGSQTHPRAYHNYVLFGGYAFSKPIEIDINDQIHEVKLINETLAAYKARWIEMPFKKGTSPWEVVVIKMDVIEETILLMKIHHSLADAYSLLYIFNSLLDNDIPQVPKETEDKFWTKTRQFFKAIRSVVVFGLGVMSTSSSLPWRLSSVDNPAYASSTSLYFPDLKLIQRKTSANYIPIVLSIFGGVLYKILNDPKLNHNKISISDAKRATYVQISLPWPNHPIKKLCNHWTSGGIRVPLGKMKALDRLKEVDEFYRSFLDDEMDKIFKRYVFPLGALIPVKLFRFLFETNRRMVGLRTLFAQVMAYNENYYEFDGNPVISVSPLTGLLGTTPVITGLAFSYKDQVQCSLIATSEVVHDQETMDRIVQNYFAEEVEKFIDELGEIK